MAQSPLVHEAIHAQPCSVCQVDLDQTRPPLDVCTSPRPRAGQLLGHPASCDQRRSTIRCTRKDPNRNKPGSDAASIALDRAGSDGATSAPAAHAARALRRQLKTRLVFTPWRRAISATEAPGKRASAIILRFSSSDHDRRDRLETRAEVGARCAGIAEFNDTGPAIRRGNVHYQLMDISPISSGATIIPELAQIG